MFIEMMSAFVAESCQEYRNVTKPMAKVVTEDFAEKSSDI
jgi:hypothetical protein